MPSTGLFPHRTWAILRQIRGEKVVGHGLRVAMLVGAALMAAAPSVAKTAVKAPTAQQSPQLDRAKAVLAELDEQRLFSDRAYAAEVARSVELIEPGLPGDIQLAILPVKMAALLTMGEMQKASLTADALIRAQPGSAAAYPVRLLGLLTQERLEDALVLLDGAAASVTSMEDRQTLHLGMSEEAVFHLRRQLGEKKDRAGQYRMAEALTKLGWPGPAKPSTRDFLRAEAAKGRLERGSRCPWPGLIGAITSE